MSDIVDKLIAALMTGNPTVIVATILLCILVYGIITLWKDNQKQQMQHREEYKGIVKEMFEVIQMNTEANTQLKDSIRELSTNIRK